MKLTIKDVSEGKAALCNDGTQDQLIKLLKLAFPDYVWLVDVLHTEAKYYYSRNNHFGWWGGGETDLPTISVKEYFESLPVRGEVVEVWDDNHVKEKRSFLAEIEGSKYPYVCVYGSDEYSFDRGEPFDTINYQHMRRIKLDEPVKMTVAEVSKALGKKIEIIEG